MASPQHFRRHHHLHIQPSSSHDSSDFPAHYSPTVHSPTFMRDQRKPPSPVSSVNSDLDHAAFDKLVAADAPGVLPDFQSYPIRSRRSGRDPLVEGLSAISHDLGGTLLPMLQVPVPKGPDNVGNPHCRGVKGIGGPMVSVAPVQAVYEAMTRSQQAKHQQAQQPPMSQPPTSQPQGQQRQQRQQQQGQQTFTMPQFSQQQPFSYDTPSYTPSPPSMKSPVELAKAPSPPASNVLGSASQPRSSPKTAAKQPKKESKEEFKTEFRFVVNEDAKTARNTVRQHVMREFRRRERWEAGKNKVSKSKKARKDAREPIKFEESPTSATKDQSSSSFTTVDSSVPDSGWGSQRRDSQAMSITSSSESCSSAPDRFSTLLAERTLAYQHRANPTVQPFAQYVDNGIELKPEIVEEAVEEIERSEVSVLPYQHDPWAEIARAEINPFSQQVSIGAGPASRALLHHYAWVMPSLMDEIVTGNVFHRIGWLYSAVAVHDPTPYYTIMGFTLAHVAMLRGMPEPALAIEHKEKSLQLIHSRLANPLVAASDGSIGAIANIAAYELIDCKPEKFAIHMQGLARLVTQRGGMSDFAFNPELEAVLIRLDVIRAYVNISAPRYAGWSTVRNLTPLSINIGPPSTDWFCPPTDFHQQQYLFAEDAIRLIHNVEDILSMMRSVHPTIPFSPDPSFKALLQDSVVHHLRKDVMDAPSFFRSHISRRVIRMVALVMIDIAAAEFFTPTAEATDHDSVHGSPHSTSNAPTRSPSQPLNRPIPKAGLPGQPIPERAAGSPQAPTDRKGLGQARLKKRFPALEHYRHRWGRSVEMIFAVLMQAERMALERPFRAWYVADIVTLTMKLGDSDWETVEHILRADLVRRILEERKRKEEQARTGIYLESAWDLEEILTHFWTEWSEE